MSTRADFLHLTVESPETGVPERPTKAARPRALWAPDGYGQQQIRSLVQQVFLTPRPKLLHHVVFCTVEDGHTDGICLQVGQALATQVSGSVGVIEADPSAEEMGEKLAKGAGEGNDLSRHSAWHMSENLWYVPLAVFLAGSKNGISTDWLQTRLTELRLEFDYTVLHGPPAGPSSEAAMLGSQSEGVILVLKANSTRRAAAQKVKQRLRDAHVRVLGAVLDGRIFPIPEAIYRKV